MENFVAAYKHPVVQAVELMMREALVQALDKGQMILPGGKTLKDVLRLCGENSEEALQSYVQLDDSIISRVRYFFVV